MKKLFLGLLLFTFNQLTFANDVNYVPGEIIAKIKPGFVTNFKVAGISIAREIKLSHEVLHVLKVDNKSANFNSLLLNLKHNPQIIYAEPNFIYHATTDDPKYPQLWGLSNTGSNDPKGKPGVAGADINALRAWEITTGSHQVKIAVIDTGVDYNHPDLKDNIWTNKKELNGKVGVDDDGDGYIDDVHGFNFASNTSDPMDGNGHGTHVAGTIGAIHNNGIGVAGVMGDVSIVPVKFLDDDGSGTLEAAVRAVDYATELNVDIMSNSWGGNGNSQALEEAIQRASDKGILFIAAAGNDAANTDTTPTFPAGYNLPNIISVAALTAANELASFSSYGKKSVHIAAPGQNILSTTNGGGYEILSGTSMATPHVSGVLGLLIAKEGRLPLDILRERLMMTGVPVTALRGKTRTASRIDAYNLLTNTRPERSGPTMNNWKVVKLDEEIQSEHPYKDDLKIHKVISIPGAKFMRLKVIKFGIEFGYDYLSVKDKNGVLIENISGKGENYTSDYVEGDSMILDFFSDRTKNGWGYEIAEVEVQ